MSEFFDLVSGREQLSLIMEEVKLCETSRLVGVSLQDAGIRRRYGIVVVAIKREDGKMLFNPEASIQLSANDILVVIGEGEGVKRLETDCEVSSRI